MADRRLPGLIESLQSRRALRRWQEAVDAGEGLDTVTLARLAPRLRDMVGLTGRLAEEADRRLIGRQIGQAGIDRPAQCDWAWRPRPWAAALTPTAVAGAVGGTKLAEGVTLFHDCPLAEISLRQSRATTPKAKAPFHLTLDALGFEGSFLSLALDLPEEGATGLRPSHIVGIDLRVWMEHPAEIFVRLNIKQGPNTEQLVSELRPGDRPDSPLSADFDLGFHDINPAKVEKAWIDLIFERPEMNLVRIDDLTLTRRPRADI
ncbi:DUF6478 family protein [Jannaschia pohangensis]|uniref:Uncharacterized protein n=1 Tax=Jannaschia pohangensis TaxID=390807 RepID=A0A1I3U2E3_9RHOB|nr:DUF6478 family protein [Jannaschia pohangensis]SFJ77714.1 hypothetical protein SAMN04488095_3618 [Jannaschia pohangensis]